MLEPPNGESGRTKFLLAYNVAHRPTIRSSSLLVKNIANIWFRSLKNEATKFCVAPRDIQWGAFLVGCDNRCRKKILSCNLCIMHHVTAFAPPFFRSERQAPAPGLFLEGGIEDVMPVHRRSGSDKRATARRTKMFGQPRRRGPFFPASGKTGL